MNQCKNNHTKLYDCKCGYTKRKPEKMKQIRAEYVSHMGDDLRVVNAARISHCGESEELSDKDKRLIRFLAKNEHMSPFEHNVMSVIVHCPLYIRSQIHRHRTFSYNEVSRRYTSEDIELHFPDQLRMQSKTNKQGSENILSEEENAYFLNFMENVCKEALYLYDRLLDKGVAREIARSILPQNLMTKFYMTGNLRNWVHFVRLRLNPHAQQEVQNIGRDIENLLKKHFPISYQCLLEEKND